jgi:hypothetical protein
MRDAPDPPEKLKPIAAAATKFQAASLAWGFAPGHPESAWVEAACEFGVAIEEKVDSIGSLPIDQIRSDIHKRAAIGWTEAAKAYQRQQSRRTIAIIAGCVVASALVAGGMGYAAGWEARGGLAATAAAELLPAFRSGVGGAVWFSRMATNNDLSALESQCQTSRYQQAGGEACSIHLWLSTPPAK